MQFELSHKLTTANRTSQRGVNSLIYPNRVGSKAPPEGEFGDPPVQPQPLKQVIREAHMDENPGQSR
jgi:hypothetical protein